MADAARKKYTRPYDDPLNPVRTEFKPVSEKQRRLWQALHDYIIANGGAVVSIPFLRTLRFEIPPGSSLAARLIELGHAVRQTGTGTRISPGRTPQEIFRTVDVIEIALPGNDKQSPPTNVRYDPKRA